MELDENADYPVTVENISFRGGDTLATLRAEDGTLWKKIFSGRISLTEGVCIMAVLELAEPALFK